MRVTLPDQAATDWSLRLREIVATSRACQGLPPQIEDPSVLDRAASTIWSGIGASGTEHARA